jgi:hypothetical protein
VITVTDTDPLDQMTETLTQIATYITFDQDSDSESRTRAIQAASDASISGDNRTLGRQGVLLPEGDDPHETLLVKAPDGTYAGACDCDGWQFHDGPCAHLWALRMREAVNGLTVPESVDYFTTLTSDTGETAAETADQPETVETEPVESLPDDEVTETREAAGQGTPVPDPDPNPSVPAETRDDAFAQSMPDVDDKYVMELNGSEYIRKAGYARLLHRAGLRVRSVEVVGAHETDWTRAKYRAKIVDSDGDLVAQQVGTAGPPEQEDLADAGMHLDELAETRAWTRAAALATGEGQTALVEVHPDKEPDGEVGHGRS